MSKMVKRIIISVIAFSLFLCSTQTVFAQKKTLKTGIKKHSNLIVSCGVCNQKAVYFPKPEYSKAAKAVGAKGSVNMRILIDERGNVISAKPISGHPLLWAESAKAALRTKFEPLLLSGKPVKVWGIVVYNFVTK
jgi:hypothetical protein